MRRFSVIVVVFLSTLSAVVNESEGQSRSGTSSSTSRFNSSLGQSSNSGSVFSGSGRSSPSSGMSGTGSIQSNATRAATGTELLRSSRGAENFVGADTGDTRNFLGFSDSGSAGSRSATRTSRTRTPSRQQYSNRSSANARRQTTTYGRSRTGQTTELQPMLSLGFEYRPPQSLGANLTSRLQQSKRFVPGGAVQVQVQDGTATLVGTAADEHERQLLEQMLALEPGIRRVDNRLTVGPAASTAQ